MSYTPPVGDSINVVFGSGYTPPTGDSINVVFGSIAGDTQAVLATGVFQKDSEKFGINTTLLMTAQAASLPAVYDPQLGTAYLFLSDQHVQAYGVKEPVDIIGFNTKGDGWFYQTRWMIEKPFLGVQTIFGSTKFDPHDRHITMGGNFVSMQVPRPRIEHHTREIFIAGDSYFLQNYLTFIYDQNETLGGLDSSQVPSPQMIKPPQYFYPSGIKLDEEQIST